MFRVIVECYYSIIITIIITSKITFSPSFLLFDYIIILSLQAIIFVTINGIVVMRMAAKIMIKIDH